MFFQRAQKYKNKIKRKQKSNNIYLTKFVIYFFGFYCFCFFFFLIMVLGLISTPKEQIQLQHLLMWVGKYKEKFLEFRNWQKFANMPRKICFYIFNFVLKCCEGCINNFFGFIKLKSKKLNSVSTK